jgi:hypothetical protein
MGIETRGQLLIFLDCAALSCQFLERTLVNITVKDPVCDPQAILFYSVKFREFKLHRIINTSQAFHSGMTTQIRGAIKATKRLKSFSRRSSELVEHQCFTPVILPTLEAEIRSKAAWIISLRILKIPYTKRAGGVAQVVQLLPSK